MKVLKFILTAFIVIIYSFFINNSIQTETTYEIKKEIVTKKDDFEGTTSILLKIADANSEDGTSYLCELYAFTIEDKEGNKYYSIIYYLYWPAARPNYQIFTKQIKILLDDEIYDMDFGVADNNAYSKMTGPYEYGFVYINYDLLIKIRESITFKIKFYGEKISTIIDFNKAMNKYQRYYQTGLTAFIEYLASIGWNN